MAQLMPLPLTVSCFKKIQTGFTFLVLAHPGSPGKRAIKWFKWLHYLLKKGVRSLSKNYWRFSLVTVWLPSVLWHCWLGGRKGIRPVKTEWWGAGVVICLERCVDLHTAQPMPLILTVSCFSKIQICLPFWYRLTWVVPDKGPLNGCVCVCSLVTVSANM